MKLPESTATVRSAGSRSSSATDSARGSMRGWPLSSRPLSSRTARPASAPGGQSAPAGPPTGTPSHGTSPPPRLVRRPFYPERTLVPPARYPSRSRSGRRPRPGRSRHVAKHAQVHGPLGTDGAGVASRFHGLPPNSPLATAEVASSAPHKSASRVSGAAVRGRPARDEHRPAGPRSTPASAVAASPDGPGGPARRTGGTGPGSHIAAWISSGSARITVRRPSAAV